MKLIDTEADHDSEAATEADYDYEAGVELGLDLLVSLSRTLTLGALGRTADNA